MRVDLNSYAKQRVGARDQCDSNCPPPQGSTTLDVLLRDVGAKIEPGPKLVFVPPLDGPKVNRKRWDLAMELEEAFWEAYEKELI